MGLNFPGIRLSFLMWVVLTALHTMAIPGIAGSGDALVRLKAAGFDDQTIEAIVREKTVETAAFSVDELIRLKSAGFKASTLQALIRSRSFLRDRNPIVYGADVKPVRLASVSDIIELKKTGIGDDVIEEIIRSASDPAGYDRERAYRLLDGMEIRIDTRPVD